LHGLTGCSGASPIPELASKLSQFEVETWALNLRGADREAPTIPRLYHAGCTDDLEDIFFQLPQDLPWRMAGFSLGANILLKWLGEKGNHISADSRAMSVSCPYDLAECSANLEQTPMARFYRYVLVRRLKELVDTLLDSHPNVLDRKTLHNCRTFFDFDEHITSPLHGFKGARDYWHRNSSIRFLTDIRIPTVLLHAQDDPFQPRPPVHVRGVNLKWEVHSRGGHVGFQESWRQDWLVERMARFVLE
jgi:predicted alpha/beta-fold hydrolase